MRERIGQSVKPVEDQVRLAGEKGLRPSILSVGNAHIVIYIYCVLTNICCLMHLAVGDDL